MRLVNLLSEAGKLIWVTAFASAICLCISVCPSEAQQFNAEENGTVQNGFVNAQLPWHKVVLDSTGKLLPWYKPGSGLAYDDFVRQEWEFLEHRVPIDRRTGLKTYLNYPIYDPVTRMGNDVDWQHNPPSAYSHIMDSLVRWYPYSGDADAIRVEREMLDYQLTHGTTPHDWDWANVPFATSCNGDKEYGHCLQDAPKRFYGGTETDKIGELGLSYVQMYEITGEKKYLDAGLDCAAQLAKHIRPGDSTHTPWPFRIDAKTGAVISGQEYGGMVVASVRLFDEIIKEKFGDTATFQKARDMAWSWILHNPLDKSSPAYDEWIGYYEDQPHDMDNENDMDSMMVCFYILSQDDPATVDPHWRTDIAHLLDRSRLLLGRGPYFGAWGIDEQTRMDGRTIGWSTSGDELVPSDSAFLLGTLNRGCCSVSGIVCRTSQWAAINAMFYEKAGDYQALEHAFRSLSYATYFIDTKEQIACCGIDFPDNYWFEDSYGDAGRSFTWAIAAAPALFAPPREDHVVASSSIIHSVKYEAQRVSYAAFDQAGTETVRLSFLPAEITAGPSKLAKVDSLTGPGYTLRDLAGGDYIVIVRHAGSGDIVITGKRG